MPTIRLRYLLLAAAAGTFGGGCHAKAWSPPQVFSEQIRTVRVVMLPDDAATHAVCAFKLGTLLPGRSYAGCFLHDAVPPTLIVPQPRAWDDSDRLDTLGHELLHAFGAMHTP